MKLIRIAHSLFFLGLGAHLGVHLDAQAQESTPAPVLDKVTVTGSSIKRLRDEGALPVQVINRRDIERAGLATAEQLVGQLTSSGNGMDNAAAQSDVVAGDQRGNNGASFANLRGQGSRNTLVLLNGRRMASHGLNGTAVNLNTIPMSAIERVEVLKDGASAIYGTDAIGGVINFITRKDLSGLQAEAFVDLPQKSGGEIYSAKLSGGVGSLERDGYNLMFALARTENKALTGQQRDFVNTFQSHRGLSVDTRGTPVATVFARAGMDTIFSPNSAGVLRPGDAQRYNGVNVLALPGAAGCASMLNSAPYDAKLWASPASALGCAWDTGVSATLQQPIENTSAIVRGTLQLGAHQLAAEYVGARVDSSKSFSEVQLISSTSARYLYPATGASYNEVFNALVAVFPSIEANRGKPIAFRWRCMSCGPREIDTSTQSNRFFVGADGPLGGSWDYRTGLSWASSEDASVLGGGYFYRDGMIAALAAGSVNPFRKPGTPTSAEELSALEAISARGQSLYGGKFTLSQADFTASGPLFALPGGAAQMAVGLDVRRETFRFTAQAGAPGGVVIAAPFDASNTVNGIRRDVRAVFAELLMPLSKTLELNAALRSDDYTGFGRSTNPKVSLRFTPLESLLMRASYSTGFRVPTFNQALNGQTVLPYDGKDLVDPAKCPSLVVSSSNPSCAVVTPNVIDGGNRALGPEKAVVKSVGFAVAPLRDYRLSLDWWHIEREDAIRAPGLAELMQNYALFGERFVRDAAGNLTAIDRRWFNAGGARSSGLELEAQGQGQLGQGRWLLSFNGSYLLSKQSRLLNTQPYGPSELAKFNRYDDPGIRWKHNISFSYSQGDWSGSLTQRYSGGYTDAVLPGVANGSVTPPDWQAKVKPYVLHDLSLSYRGFKQLEVTAGVKNLFNQDPPFSAYYDADLGAGSSWDPRVADPRGRAFTLRLRYTLR
ncbi:TonB-dependent receptor plug domain-containing protein [Roseateles sp. BYS180W]|uniref:TonB-dependent receptor plug domain-containing protein n=1 Tax=Roseateles rivi TaxID=3299028 RepID=A0ABW7FVK4_9BURK